ncbi:MAG: hypothetical protein IIA61_03045 [Candidatus Marinimicrobia bacterium]|nr:hypothetical protein [Candidatus Neomarinimicrobiota bacterium]
MIKKVSRPVCRRGRQACRDTIQDVLVYANRPAKAGCYSYLLPDPDFVGRILPARHQSGGQAGEKTGNDMMITILSLSFRIYLIFISLVTFLYSNSLPIPPDDPTYIYLRQEFRRTHNLSLYIQPFPFTTDNFKIPYYHLPDKNGYLRIAPSSKISGDVTDIQYHFWVAGRWQNISILAKPVVVKDYYGEDVLGQTYTRGGVSGRLTNAFIRYGTDNITLQLGRSPVWWGQSWESSIIQSGITPSYDHLDIRINLGSYHLEILAGQLGSEQTVDGNRIKRNIASHRLTWLPPHKKWVVGLGEQIIYTGVSRSFEWTYLNPFVPYFFTALEKDEETTNGSDNDNSIIFLYGRYNFKDNLSFFGEFIIDDYQVDKNDTSNPLGWKVGIDGGFSVLDREFTFEAELNRINSWTYIHHGEFTTWQNRGHAIGYKYGPDNWSVMFLADYWVRKNILLSVKYTHLEKGANTLQTVWASPGTKDVPFPTPPITIYQFTTISLSWHAKYGILEAGWSNEPFPSDIAYSSPPYQGGNSRSEQGGVYLKAQLVWGFGFDLE